MNMEVIQNLVQAHGLWLLAPVSILEGPIVTVIAAYMASLGLMNIYAVYVVCVVGDLIGDVALYMIGRFGPRSLPGRWQLRLGLRRKQRKGLQSHFREVGGRTLIIGKLTHSAGAAVLVAAGAGKMSFGSFVWWNLLGTLPKTALFAIVGYLFGYAYSTIDSYIFRASMIMLVLMAVVAGIWFMRRRNASADEADQ